MCCMLGVSLCMRLRVCRVIHLTHTHKLTHAEPPGAAVPRIRRPRASTLLRGQPTYFHTHTHTLHTQSHLEQLFHKFEGLVQARSLEDSLRLLDLLKKLASSDTSRVNVSVCVCV